MNISTYIVDPITVGEMVNGLIEQHGESDAYCQAEDLLSFYYATNADEGVISEWEKVVGKCLDRLDLFIVQQEQINKENRHE